MSVEENKATMRRFLEGLNQKNLAVVDEIYDANYIAHVVGRQEVRGSERVKELLTTLFSDYPDLHWTIESMVAKGDKVLLRYTTQGTHNREITGIPPTGKEITASGVSIYRIAGGKVVEGWDITNQLGMLQELGAIPTP